MALKENLCDRFVRQGADLHSRAQAGTLPFQAFLIIWLLLEKLFPFISFAKKPASAACSSFVIRLVFARLASFCRL